MNVENFDRLHANHYAEIFRFCFKMVKYQQDAEDLTNETFVKAYYHFDPDQKTSFRTFIFKIAKNLCLDYCKSKKFKRRKIIISINDAPLVEDPTTTNGDLQHREILAILYKCLDKLENTEEKISIRLYFIDQFVYKQIANIINTSINTVKNRIESGLKKLKKCLEQKGIINFPLD